MIYLYFISVETISNRIRTVPSFRTCKTRVKEHGTTRVVYKISETHKQYQTITTKPASAMAIHQPTRQTREEILYSSRQLVIKKKILVELNIGTENGILTVVQWFHVLDCPMNCVLLGQDGLKAIGIDIVMLLSEAARSQISQN